jgi:imidazolonepropionase-like amidohydrolase
MINNLFNRSQVAKVALVIAGLLMAAHAQAATHIFASKLITSEDSKIQSDKTVIVEDNKIIKIVDGKDEGGEGDTFIDLTGSTLMPGLMDMHVHLSFQMKVLALI